VQSCAFCGKPIFEQGRKFCGPTCRQFAWRRAVPPAARRAMGVPHCQVCGKPIKGAVRLVRDRQGRLSWASKFCDHACRQTAYRRRQALTPGP